MSRKQLKFEQVEKEIRQLTRTLPIGSKIPPERHLAVTYECNFLTVRKALKALVDEGIITRRIGSGTFIAKHPEANHQNSDFQPKKIANQIGVLVFRNGNAYANKVLQNIAHSAMELGLELRSTWITGFGEESFKQAQALANDGCVAIVLPWFPHHMAGEVRKFIEQSPIPVSIPLLISGLEANYFGDPELFGRNLLKPNKALCGYLKEMGCQKVAFVGPTTSEDPILQRMLTAYTLYVSENDIPNLSVLVEPGSQHMDRIAEKWKTYAGELGILCYDDEHALRMITAMHKIGLKAPTDYSIIGRNDTEAGRFSDPPLTTIGHDFRNISNGLLRNALALTRNTTDHTESSPLPKLLVRESCGGLGRINDELRKKFSVIDFIKDIEIY
ncbi:MAG TPA: transcriptional regulator [Opitutae bacterium]|nr:transcriptional regulator [Puniceicoccaceae bacterium]HBR92831.1 transcriptional regulator [Opitutae bacterium]|tara:strand:- start:7666 stop:8826 length:1161 start_codon:yes stop_codon:yes gene_type:complete